MRRSILLCTGLAGLLSLVATSQLATAAPSCPKVKTSEPFCFRGDALVLRRFQACGTTAVFCVNDASDTAECVAVDLVKGTYHRARAAGRKARVVIRQQRSGVRVCMGARCVATDLPVSEATYEVDASDDGKLAVVTGQDLGNKVVVINTATGKRTRTVELPTNASDELGPAYFVGNRLFALVGQWPIERGFLIEPGGKPREIADEIFARGKPIDLGAGRWAIEAGGGVSVVDVRTGAVTRSTPPLDSLPVCYDCFGMANDPGLVPSRVAQAAGGKLALINVTGISVVDARTLATTRTFPLPICKRPRP